MKPRAKRIPIFTNHIYLLYSLVFVGIFVLCFIGFPANGKSLFRSYDGLDQHYIAFVYIGKWLRQIIKHIFVDHSFSVPLWDLSIGYGSDILTTLGAYLPDPFNWFSVFFAPKYAELAFDFTIILKFYTVGLSFCYYGLHKGYKKNAVLFGAVLYTFSATSFVAFFESFFINPMYIFPLVITGLDKIWGKKNPALYVFALAFSFINYFYFAYMTCVFILGYCVIHYFFDYKEKKSLKDLMKWGMRVFAYSVIAIGISSVVLLPILNVITGQGRLSVAYYLPTLYSSDYYRNLPLGFITFFSPLGRDAIMGFSFFALPCLWWAFKNYRQNKKPLIEFISLSVLLCVPFLGHVMNGFSYYANRWIWAYSLCVSNIACISCNPLQCLTQKDRYKLALFLSTYIVCAVLLSTSPAPWTFSVIGLVVVFLLVLLLEPIITNKLFSKAAVCFLLAASVIVPAFFWADGLMAEEVAVGSALTQVTNSNGLPALNGLAHNDGYRYDAYPHSSVANASWIASANGIDSYISLYNNDVVNYHNSLALNTSLYLQSYYGLDGRSEMEFLSGVKYYLVPQSHKTCTPVGYSDLISENKTNGGSTQVYSNPRSLPIVYSYAQSLSTDVYEKATPYERQQLLMRACVINESKNMTINLPDDRLPYQETLSAAVRKTKTGYEILKEDGTITFKFQPCGASELYVYFDKLLLDEKDPAIRFSLTLDAYSPSSASPILNKGITVGSNRFHMYGGKDNWLVNLGYTDELIDSVTITFKKPGTYSLDNIILYSKPKEEIKDSTTNLIRSTNGVRVSTNQITATVQADSPQFIFVSVPYSSGWKATLNGKAISIHKANLAFMAIPVDAGQYELVLQYKTPGLAAGAVLSGLSFCLAMIIVHHYKKREINNECL